MFKSKHCHASMCGALSPRCMAISFLAGSIFILQNAVKYMFSMEVSISLCLYLSGNHLSNLTCKNRLFQCRQWDITIISLKLSRLNDYIYCLKTTSKNIMSCCNVYHDKKYDIILWCKKQTRFGLWKHKMVMFWHGSKSCITAPLRVKSNGH